MAGYIEIVNEDGTHSLVPTIEERDKQEQLGNIDTLTNEMDILLNVNGSNKNNNPLANAEQFRKVIQFLQILLMKKQPWKFLAFILNGK